MAESKGRLMMQGRSASKGRSQTVNQPEEAEVDVRVCLFYAGEDSLMSFSHWLVD